MRKYVNVAKAIQTEYKQQADDLVVFAQSALSFTAAGIIKETYIDDNNILIVLFIAVLSVNIFRELSASITVLMDTAVVDTFHEVGSESNLNLVISSTSFETDYAVPYAIHLLYNPLTIIVNAFDFGSRMTAQLISMIAVTYVMDMPLVVIMAAFGLLQIAMQAAEASEADPITPPPSPTNCQPGFPVRVPLRTPMNVK
jgi:hypothetical protein